MNLQAVSREVDSISGSSQIAIIGEVDDVRRPSQEEQTLHVQR